MNPLTPWFHGLHYVEASTDQTEKQVVVREVKKTKYWNFGHCFPKLLRKNMLYIFLYYICKFNKLGYL